MNKAFITLSFLMGVVVLTSNYLVQFPINYFGLNSGFIKGCLTFVFIGVFLMSTIEWE